MIQIRDTIIITILIMFVAIGCQFTSKLMESPEKENLELKEKLELYSHV